MVKDNVYINIGLFGRYEDEGGYEVYQLISGIHGYATDLMPNLRNNPQFWVELELDSSTTTPPEPQENSLKASIIWIIVPIIFLLVCEAIIGFIYWLVIQSKKAREQKEDPRFEMSMATTDVYPLNLEKPVAKKTKIGYQRRI